MPVKLVTELRVYPTTVAWFSLAVGTTVATEGAAREVPIKRWRNTARCENMAQMCGVPEMSERTTSKER